MHFDNLFVITYGRSGSTLVQGLLNSIDGVLIRGENGNFCFALYQAYRGLSMARSQDFAPRILGTPRHPWFGNGELSPASFKRHVRALVEEQLVGSLSPRPRCWGFKEIRHTRRDVGDRLPDYLDFLGEVFPRSGFVFNTRNLDAVVQSGWWRNQPASDVRGLLQGAEEQFRRYCEGRANAFAITYEEVLARAPRLRELFDFVGAPYDAQRVEGVLALPHSS